MSTATLTFSDPGDTGKIEISLDFDPPLQAELDQPAPYTHALAAMALQRVREIITAKEASDA